MAACARLRVRVCPACVQSGGVGVQLYMCASVCRVPRACRCMIACVRICMHRPRMCVWEWRYVTMCGCACVRVSVRGWTAPTAQDAKHSY